jgi:Zn-dependent protease with chaperone function
MMERTSQIVGTFLANALWQVTLLVLATSWCERFARRRSVTAKSRHLLWAGALILSVVFPLLSLQYWAESGRLYYASIGDAADLPPALFRRLFHVIARSPGPIFISQQFAQFLLFGYLAFLTYRLARFCAVYLRTAMIRRRASAKPVPEVFMTLFESIRRNLSVRSEPKLLISVQDGPMTCGIADPVIVVPEALLAETSPVVITSVLGHELAHIKRHDFFVNIIYELVFLPVSFHPAAWFIRQRLEQTRELACDEMVAGPLLDPSSYAQSLFSVMQSLSTCDQHGCGLGSYAHKVEERFEAILSAKSRSRSECAWALTAFALITTILIVANSRFTLIPCDGAMLTASAVSIPEARSIALRYLPGEVVGEEISRKKGVLLYSFYVRTEAGIGEVYIKAASGEVTRVKHAKHPQG